MKNNNTKTLTILRNLNGDALIYTLLHDENSHELFLGELYSRGGENNLLEFISELIIRDNNAVSVNFAKEKTPSDYVLKAYSNDVYTIFEAADNAAKNGGFNLGKSKYNLNDFEYLSNFYKTNGYGIFIKNIAFSYDGTALIPI